MPMRALIPHEGTTAPVNERLLLTFFIAALIHGMLILGLSFGGSASHDSSIRGIDVLLVSDELPTTAANDSAAYLAQRTQLGSGNTSGPAVAHNQAADAARAAQASSPAAARADDEVLTTTATRTDFRYFAATPSQGTSPPQPSPVTSETPRPPGEDGAVQLRGVQRNELWITPDTRESIVAPYLDNWRNRVERIGTLNYPIAARRVGAQANPILEVAIDSDGRLAKAEIMASSGYADLDAAALAILKLASPFDPFPPDLAARYQTLRFAYEWRFTGGRIAPGPVTAVP
jgi:protein TonB